MLVVARMGRHFVRGRKLPRIGRMIVITAAGMGMVAHRLTGMVHLDGQRIRAGKCGVDEKHDGENETQ